jgi:tetratricopeptide (TPR) repeat protein
MKLTMLLLVLLYLISFLFAADNTGIVKYVCGEVKYKAGNSAKFTNLSINDTVQLNGTIKTGLDSEVEIKWSDKTVSKLSANKTSLVSALYDETHKSGNWKGKLNDKLNQLSLQNKQKSTTVAGVRRDEAEVKVESDLYWDTEPMIALDKAVEVFQKQKYAEAIPLFLQIIEQAPLNKAAESSRGYLIISYNETGDKDQRDFQIQKLKEDFPNSILIESLDIKDK